MRSVTRSLLLALTTAAVLAVPLRATAEQAAPAGDGAQIEQLQKQLTELQQQMAALQKTIASPTIPEGQRAMMAKHMEMMQQGWKGMHDQGCAMHPAEGCSHMGGAMGMGGGGGMGMGMKSPGQ